MQIVEGIIPKREWMDYVRKALEEKKKTIKILNFQSMAEEIF